MSEFDLQSMKQNHADELGRYQSLTHGYRNENTRLHTRNDFLEGQLRQKDREIEQRRLHSAYLEYLIGFLQEIIQEK